MEKVQDFTIYGVSGSEAENYAFNNGFNFVDLNDLKDITESSIITTITETDSQSLVDTSNIPVTTTVTSSETSENTSMKTILIIVLAILIGIVLGVIIATSKNKK